MKQISIYILVLYLRCKLALHKDSQSSDLARKKYRVCNSQREKKMNVLSLEYPCLPINFDIERTIIVPRSNFQRKR